MSKSYEYLFQYLYKLSIEIDKDEFLFQIQSHPDYSSLLAISDTLSFFNINNKAFKINFNDLSSLPDYYITILTEENNSPKIYFLEKKGDFYFCGSDKIKITHAELEKRWLGIVFLIEKPLQDSIELKNTNTILVPLVIFLLFLSQLCISNLDFLTKLFFVFPLLGILFSFASLKDLFNIKNELVNNFCNITSSTSCSSIISSKKWKLFEYVNFSDLSIVFFFVQFISLIIFILSKNIEDYFIIQKTILFCSIPILFLSLYFQKFIEKKWCPICLTIILLIVLELFYITFVYKLDFEFNIKSIILFYSIFMIVLFVWSKLKILLLKNKELKEFQLIANRFARNYESFKLNLLGGKKIHIPLTAITLGNKSSKSTITIITNPFCGYCKDAQKIINFILENYKNNVQVNLIIKASIGNEKEDIKSFFITLYGIYMNKGENDFLKALNYWFDNKNIEKWLLKYRLENINNMKIEAIYHGLYEWCQQNNFNYTPALFVNGYEYPNHFDKENLKFYINEIIEDNTY